MYSDYYGHNGPLTWRQERLTRRLLQIREFRDKVSSIPETDELYEIWDRARYDVNTIRGYMIEERDRLAGQSPGSWGDWEKHIDKWLDGPFMELLNLEFRLDEYLDYPSRTGPLTRR